MKPSEGAVHRGFIKLFRRLCAHPLWLGEKFTRGQAWVDLLLLANHKDGFIRVRGVKFTVKRGQCGWSAVKLAERWRWSRGKVIRFLNELETVQQIEQQKNNVTSLISILNYDQHQSDSAASESINGQQTGSKRYTNKNEKNEKNEKINKRSSEFHDHFWPAYPVKKAKQKALSVWESLAVKNALPPIEKILSAIESQKKEKAALTKAGAFCPEWKHPTTWLNQGCWDDEPISIDGSGKKPWHI